MFFCVRVCVGYKPYNVAENQSYQMYLEYIEFHIDLCCIAVIQLYYGNINIMTTWITNEYTSLWKYKSLTIYSWKGDVDCV